MLLAKESQKDATGCAGATGGGFCQHLPGDASAGNRFTPDYQAQNLGGFSEKARNQIF
ncbi:hypothetical protein GCM10011533_16520 [Streptosporangium jomthongense]|nr:hypothetical protein GCM10011533_16520 [Streptosporangium jomthongense]